MSQTYNAKSAKDLVAHRTEAILEDYDWMMECGESFDGAAARLGMKPNTLDRLLDRHRGGRYGKNKGAA